jgi:hypothetical protein
LFSYLAGDITSFPGAAFSLLKAAETQEEEPDFYIHIPVATDGKIMEEAQRLVDLLPQPYGCTSQSQK